MGGTPMPRLETNDMTGECKSVPIGQLIEPVKTWKPSRSPSDEVFKDVGTLDRGVSKYRPRNAPELLGGPYPLVQTGEVSNCDGYIRSHVSTYSESGLRQSKMWPAGTLCITIAANIAKTGILTFPSCFPDSVVGFAQSIRQLQNSFAYGFHSSKRHWKTVRRNPHRSTSIWLFSAT